MVTMHLKQGRNIASTLKHFFKIKTQAYKLLLFNSFILLVKTCLSNSIVNLGILYKESLDKESALRVAQYLEVISW